MGPVGVGAAVDELDVVLDTLETPSDVVPEAPRDAVLDDPRDAVPDTTREAEPVTVGTAEDAEAREALY